MDAVNYSAAFFFKGKERKKKNKKQNTFAYLFSSLSIPLASTSFSLYFIFYHLTASKVRLNERQS